MFIKNAWYVAAWADEISDRPLARRICNEPVALYRDMTGKAAALIDMCCHRGAPLHMGRVVEQGLECGYHGLIFGADGTCVKIPGQDRIPERARVRSFPLVEQDGFLWIWPGEAAKADPAAIVPYPWHNDTTHWPHRHTMYPIKASAMLMVDNLMDLTHLGYVHGSTIGGNPMIHVEAKMETIRTELGLKFTRWMLNSVPPPTYVRAVGFEGWVMEGSQSMLALTLSNSSRNARAGQSQGQALARSRIEKPMSRTFAPTSRPSVRSMMKRAACSPIAAPPMWTVLSAGCTSAANPMSPKPSTAKSSGTRNPCACASMMRPWASTSELQHTASIFASWASNSSSAARPLPSLLGAGTTHTVAFLAPSSRNADSKAARRRPAR